MTTDDDRAFGALLRQYRLVAGLSQQALAEQAGMSLRGLSDLERGVRQAPYPATVARLAEALGLGSEERVALATAGRRAGRSVAAGRPPESRAPSLPIPLSSFVGRDQELAEIRRLLADARLLTLAGAGGIGKTRLALEVARLISSEATWTAAFVDHAPVVDPVAVPQATAAALGVHERAGRALQDVVADAIGARAVLLVLDNCEHVGPACAELADRLLRVCPRLRILATSREPLGVDGEVVWRVPSLRLPAPHAPTPRDEFVDAESVRLFVERARAAVPGFALDGGSAVAVAEVCRRLDGIPLALELAAARVRALSVEQIAVRLDDRFRLLVGGSRTALPRHRTLAATLEWSDQLLGAAERALLRRLSVFAGGWALEAAEAVGAGEPVASHDLLDLLTSLVDKSLVLAEPAAAGGEERYRLLETIRQYFGEGLRAAGEETATRDRHLGWTVVWAENSAPRLVGRDQVRWLRRIALEHDNFRTALEWSRTHGQGQAELRLAAALGRYWHLHGPSSEGRFWLRHALDNSRPEPSAARAHALNWAGRLATVNGDADDRDLLEASVALAGELDEAGLLALALRHLSMAHQRHGDELAAQATLEEALRTARRAGDRREEAFALVSLGAAAQQAGDATAAARLLAEGLAIGREVGDAGPIGWALSVLGSIAARRGHDDEAASLFQEALDVSRPMGYWAVTVAALAQLGALERARGNLAAARRNSQACITAAQEIGDLGLVAAALAFSADLDLKAGRLERGIRLLSAESAWRTALGARRYVSFWSWPAPAPEEARARMGEEAFARAWAAGQRMTLAQAVQEALEH